MLLDQKEALKLVALLLNNWARRFVDSSLRNYN